MKNKVRQMRPKKSLRTLLVVWFLLFAVVPLAFITGYSLVKFEQAIDQELSQRLRGNAREIGVILKDIESGMQADIVNHSSDTSFIYYMSTNNIEKAREVAQKWMKSSLSQRISVFNRNGRLDIALYKDVSGQVRREANLEQGAVELNAAFLENMNQEDEISAVDIRERKGKDPGAQGQVDFVKFRKVKTASGLVVGYIEEVIGFDRMTIDGLKNRMNIELFFFAPDKEPVVSSHIDLSTYSSSFFNRYLESGSVDFFDINLRETPYRFMLAPLKWGETKIILGLGASKSTARTVLQNVNYAFFSVVGVIVFLIIILSFITSRILLRPLYEILEAIERADFQKGLLEVPETNETELGLLSYSFNQMSRRVFEIQKDLKDKIKQLEQANTEIRDTQAKLVHTGKMASLGQLVAGIAHELNNPIGFIYSNMAHLREYTEKLMSLIKTAESDPSELKAAKEQVDFDYITQDLPKLISSCEDGARRTRDIVLGLRNFSRLEEAQTKEVDLHEGLENTLNLLTGELKNRIQVKKEFGPIPRVTCYPSQLNQVFMNILSNATQAIEGEGEIRIRTRRLGKDQVEVAIKDSGKGMPRDTVDKVFDPFFTTKTVGSGTGLGLSISYGVVQKHGGDIRVESEPGKGTEFFIRIPIKAPTA